MLTMLEFFLMSSELEKMAATTLISFLSKQMQDPVKNTMVSIVYADYRNYMASI